MTEDSKAEVGDEVRVEVGGKWHKAAVTRTWTVPDGYGNAMRVYVVRFASGSEMPCGNNSIRKPRNARAT